MGDSAYRRWIVAGLWLSACVTVQAQDAPDWAWSPTARMAEARYDSCAVSLADGRVLIAGGSAQQGALKSVELYSPTGAFVNVAAMGKERSRHTCTLLGDGRVLVAGGDTDNQATAELYDPAADAWTLIADPGPVRSGHTATPLFDGRVLLAGGGTDALSVFDPAANAILPLALSLAVARSNHRAAVLDGGRVLIIGGAYADQALRSSEIFDPSVDEIKPGPDLGLPRQGHSATRLIDGRVLVAGGSDGSGELGNAELYLPDENRFDFLSAQMQSPRADHLAILVEGNGSVVLAGGSQGGAAIAESEVFQPWDNTFASTGPLTAPRKQLTGALLPGGSVLAAGGLNDDGPSAGCGIITAALSFTQSTYFDTQTATALVNTTKRTLNTVDFSLFVQNGSALAPIQSRLLTPNPANVNGAFPPAPVMLVGAQDDARTFVVKSAALGASASFLAKGNTTMTITRLGSLATAGLPFRARVTVSATNDAHALEGTWGFATQSAGLTASPSGLPTTLPLASGFFSTEVEFCCAPTTPGSSFSVQGTYSGSAFYNSAHSFIDQSFSVVDNTLELDGLGGFPGLQALTLSQVSASVSPPFGGGIYTRPPPPTGTLAISKSGVTVGTFPLTPVGVTGMAQFTYTPTLAELGASVCFQVQYSGDAHYKPVSGPLCGLVRPAGSTLTISSQSTSYTFGVPVQIKATVTFPSGLGPIGGTVQLGQRRNVNVGTSTTTQFFPFGTGDTITLTPGTGQAIGTTNLVLPFTITNIDIAGGFGITAFYTSPSISLLSGSSTTLSMPRNKVDTQVVCQAVAATPVTALTPITLKATINYPTGVPLAAGVEPTGSVQFTDNGVALGSVSTPPNSTTNPPNQPVQVSLPAITRPSGVHNFQAKYVGDTNFATSQSANATVTVQ